MSSVLCALNLSALSTGDAPADALFASPLQRSGQPSTGLITRGLAPGSRRQRSWRGAS